MTPFFQSVFFFNHTPSSQRDGITLLIAVVLLSAILSISFGVFQIIYSQFLLSGEMQNSFDAFYAADQGIEKVLIMDRDGTPLCAPDCTLSVSSPVLPSGACYEYIVTKIGNMTNIQIFGRHTCALGRRLILRALQVTY
ncbi:MAG: hypothetical protein AAB930_03855 [Patescibacteria group bacterium]